MRKSYVLLSDGLSVVILRDDSSSFVEPFFVISHSWRLLYTCGYLWDSSSKDQCKCHFLLQVAYFRKRIESRLCDILHQKNAVSTVFIIGLCLSHPPRGGEEEERCGKRHSRVASCTTPGGGVGSSTKFYTGRLRPEVQRLTLLYTIFDRKRSPFSCTFHWKMVPLSHTYLYCIPFLSPWNAVYGRRILGDHSITWRDVNQKSVLLSTRKVLIKGPFKYLKDRFPYPFIAELLAGRRPQEWSPIPILRGVLRGMLAIFYGHW